jgi:hypothetical protein
LYKGEQLRLERLIACLDHQNEKVVEAALAALCTLLEDGLDIVDGVFVLYEAEGIQLILDVLLENRGKAEGSLGSGQNFEDRVYCARGGR